MTATFAGAGTEQAVPRRADGLELIGEMAGSGYRVPPSLVRRIDGQTIQLTPLLYATLRAIDGQRSAAEVASAVSGSTGRSLNAENVVLLVEEKLRPLGLVVGADGSEPSLKKRNPLLGLRFRYAITDPDRTRRLTDPFRFLFRPWTVMLVLAAFAVVCWWVFLRKGLASAAYDAFERPGLLILVFAVTVLSAGFHEFGHAAAARYGGATPGVMGVGLYLVWPAFYTDVTDSYRLGRGGRLRTDLGGLYFNVVVAVVITAVWYWLRYDALLLVVATQIIQMVRQLAPLVRFDGYHVLADLTGVPDLYGRIKPILVGLLPWKRNDPRVRELKPWARIVVTVWVLVVVPLLLASLAFAVYALPRLIGTAWSSLNKQQDIFASAVADGDMVQAVARILAMIAIIIPMAGIIYLLVRFTRHAVTSVWRATAGKPLMRLVAGVFGAAVLAGVGTLWLDGNNYRPIQANERGNLGDIVFALGVREAGNSALTADTAQPVAATRSLAPGQRGAMWALWDTGHRPPTVNSPQLAVILIPRTPPGAVPNGGYLGAGPATSADQGWVFPVDRPLAPEEGDTQALAVNTTPGTTEYDVAVAMIWETDSEDTMNVNEAHAYASCFSCAAVAVSYQVVFVIDEDKTNDNVAAPQNLAGALNYKCINCMTYAFAQQLFITLDRPLSPKAKAELEALWSEIEAYGEAIDRGEVPLDEIEPQFEEYTNQIKAIVERDQPGTFPTAPPTSSLTVAVTTVAPASPTTTSPPPTETPTETPTPEPTETGEPETDSTSEQTTADQTSGESTASSEPSATSDPTAEPSTSDGTTTDGSTSDTSTSDGSTSDSSGTSP